MVVRAARAGCEFLIARRNRSPETIRPHLSIRCPTQAQPPGSKVSSNSSFLKRTTIRNLTMRLRRSYSQSGAAHARKLEKSFRPRLDE
jgi:hypothetical protein